jgi:hypothetical protein
VGKARNLPQSGAPERCFTWVGSGLPNCLPILFLPACHEKTDKTEGQKDKKTDRQLKQKDRRTEGEKDKKTDRWTDRQFIISFYD